MFSDLLPDDLERLDSQRKLVRIEARARFGAALNGRKDDLIVLQRMLDQQAYSAAQRYELQCMGVCFGDTLASESQFRWAIIEDEYGRDPTLRWNSTSMNLNALTIISKRIERAENVELSQIWLWAIARGEEADLRELG
jgi:hypothetical protein